LYVTDTFLLSNKEPHRFPQQVLELEVIEIA
jgi:hypothetical protein